MYFLLVRLCPHIDNVDWAVCNTLFDSSASRCLYQELRTSEILKPQKLSEM